MNMDNHKDMSFLPEDYVQGRIAQRTNLLCLSLFALVMVGIVGAYMVTSRHRAQVRQELREISSAYTDAARRIEQADKLQEQQRLMLSKAKVTAGLLEPVPRTFLLSDLINRMPETLSLIELQVDTKKVRQIQKVDPKKSALANKKPAFKKVNVAPPVYKHEVKLVLVGLATTDVEVAGYMASLTKSPFLSDVSLVYSEQSQFQEDNMRKFRVEMNLAEGADARKIDPLTPERPEQGLKHNPMAPKKVPTFGLDALLSVIPGTEK
jgi:Tfp pilus assembly protein PilN